MIIAKPGAHLNEMVDHIRMACASDVQATDSLLLMADGYLAITDSEDSYCGYTRILEKAIPDNPASVWMMEETTLLNGELNDVSRAVIRMGKPVFMAISERFDSSSDPDESFHSVEMFSESPVTRIAIADAPHLLFEMVFKRRHEGVYHAVQKALYTTREGA